MDFNYSISLNFENIKEIIFTEISQFINPGVTLEDDSPLIGGESMLDSMKLVELCLRLEDKATEMGFEFDWTSDSAMSSSKSMFRNAGSLANEFIKQLKSSK